MTGFTPYLLILLAGFVPNEAFRLAAVVLARGVDERSRLFVWIKIVATTLLAAVVSRLVYAPGPSLAAVPTPIRIAGIAVGVGAYFLCRRSLVLGILAGEAAFIGLALLFAT